MAWHLVKSAGYLKTNNICEMLNITMILWSWQMQSAFCMCLILSVREKLYKEKITQASGLGVRSPDLDNITGYVFWTDFREKEKKNHC